MKRKKMLSGCNTRVSASFLCLLFFCKNNLCSMNILCLWEYGIVLCVFHFVAFKWISFFFVTLCERTNRGMRYLYLYREIIVIFFLRFDAVCVGIYIFFMFWLARKVYSKKKKEIVSRSLSCHNIFKFICMKVTKCCLNFVSLIMLILTNHSRQKKKRSKKKRLCY